MSESGRPESKEKRLAMRIFLAKALRVTSLMRRLAEKLGTKDAEVFARNVDLDMRTEFEVLDNKLVEEGEEPVSLSTLQFDFSLPSLAQFEEKFMAALKRRNNEGEEWKE